MSQLADIREVVFRYDKKRDSSSSDCDSPCDNSSLFATVGYGRRFPGENSLQTSVEAAGHGESIASDGLRGRQTSDGNRRLSDLLG
ncbi:hypothetical protein F3Y22_tig00111392pilonHSYRG00344 [Hibiscus syriacus]|uniref:Uncharacterized protein n=1 Tax=Hibiscus syriacus TaxID=106335 RepID=A0A6A2YK88_HIBSY|nr:hypothetical protein F3Y22_tig00111392pilonHSYRG00344 [Hibiscus syriacus]